MILPKVIITEPIFRDDESEDRARAFKREYDTRITVTVWAEYEALFDHKVFKYVAQGIDAPEDSILMTWDEGCDNSQLRSLKVIIVNSITYFPAYFHIYFKNREDYLLYALKHGITEIKGGSSHN